MSIKRNFVSKGSSCDRSRGLVWRTLSIQLRFSELSLWKCVQIRDNSDELSNQRAFNCRSFTLVRGHNAPFNQVSSGNLRVYLSPSPEIDILAVFHIIFQSLRVRHVFSVNIEISNNFSRKSQQLSSRNHRICLPLSWIPFPSKIWICLIISYFDNGV